MTRKERNAPTVEEFDLYGEDDSQFYYDPENDHEKWYWLDCWEEYSKDLEHMMLQEMDQDKYDWDSEWWGDEDEDWITCDMCYLQYDLGVDFCCPNCGN